jgi:hypothetical protein
MWHPYNDFLCIKSCLLFSSFSVLTVWGNALLFIQYRKLYVCADTVHEMESVLLIQCRYGTCVCPNNTGDEMWFRPRNIGDTVVSKAIMAFTVALTTFYQLYRLHIVTNSELHSTQILLKICSFKVDLWSRPSTRHEGAWGRGGIASTHSRPGHYMGVSGQRHSPVAF